MTHSLFPTCHPLRASDPPIDSGSGLPIPPAGHGTRDGTEDDPFSGGVDSAVRKHTADNTEQDQPPRYLFARVSVFLIMLMWVISGFFKIKDMSAFVDIVETHAVLPEKYENLLWWVGPGELVMGLLLVFVMGSELRKPFGKLVLLISMTGILGFTYYISLVDPVVLQESGCGCLSDYRIASGIEGSERFIDYGKNGILLILHVVALLGPAMVDSRRKSAA
ncbi:MAG: MauE/DoxX family redox-associated membrane protein [Phycisphaerales bacterium JB052]